MRPKDPGKTARMRRELREELKGKKTVVTIYIILRVLVILTMVAQFLNGNFENVFLCILTLVLFTLPTVIERRVRIDLPDTLEIIILLFIFSAEILGEIQLTTPISMAGTPCSIRSTASSARPSASPCWTF